MNTMCSGAGDPVDYRERKSPRSTTLCRAPCQSIIFFIGVRDSRDSRSIKYASMPLSHARVCLCLMPSRQGLSRWENSSLSMRKSGSALTTSSGLCGRCLTFRDDLEPSLNPHHCDGHAAVGTAGKVQVGAAVPNPEPVYLKPLEKIRQDRLDDAQPRSRWAGAVAVAHR